MSHQQRAVWDGVCLSDDGGWFPKHTNPHVCVIILEQMDLLFNCSMARRTAPDKPTYPPLGTIWIVPGKG